MAGFIKGDVLILAVWNSVAVAYEPIACLTSNAMSQTRNIIEAQTKCLPGVVEKGAGSLNNEFSFEGLYTDDATGNIYSHGKLFGLMNSGANVDVRMSTGLTGAPNYYATGIISDLSLDAPAGDEFGNFSGTLSVSGNVTTTNPHP